MHSAKYSHKHHILLSPFYSPAPAMHIPVSMSCHHEAVSAYGPMSCPSLSLSPRRCLMLRAGAALVPLAACSQLQSPGSCQPTVHPGSFEPCSQDFWLFCYSQPCVSLSSTCFLLPHFQLLLLEVCAFLPPASSTVHYPSPSLALILAPFLPSFLPSL